MTENYFQSNEFRRISTTAADSSIKLFFKYLSISVMAVFSFIGDMFRQVMGK
jgi:hypothetical protein